MQVLVHVKVVSGMVETVTGAKARSFDLKHVVVAAQTIDYQPVCDQRFLAAPPPPITSRYVWGLSTDD